MTTKKSSKLALTSAEAGFVYAAGRCERLAQAKKRVDRKVSPTVAEACDVACSREWAEVEDELEATLFEQWWRRGAIGACEDRRRAMQWTISAMETARIAHSAQAVVARRELAATLRQLGGDLSPLREDTFDLRCWLGWDKKDRLGARLVIVGGVLVGALQQAVIRRRVASLLRQLPPAVHQSVRRGLAGLGGLEPAVERRVYEVYRRMSDRGYRADEELAMIGLYFVINAVSFRQNFALDRFETCLPEGLHSYCVAFRRACARSHKPELNWAVQNTIQAVVTATSGGQP